MLSDISHWGIGDNGDLLDVLVMISHKAKMARHRPKALPPWKGGHLDDETGESSLLFNVGINGFRELLKVVLFQPGPGSHVQNRMLRVECVFDHNFAPMNVSLFSQPNENGTDWQAVTQTESPKGERINKISYDVNATVKLV